MVFCSTNLIVYNAQSDLMDVPSKTTRIKIKECFLDEQDLLTRVKQLKNRLSLINDLCERNNFELECSFVRKYCQTEAHHYFPPNILRFLQRFSCLNPSEAHHYFPPNILRSLQHFSCLNPSEKHNLIRMIGLISRILTFKPTRDLYYSAKNTPSSTYRSGLWNILYVKKNKISFEANCDFDERTISIQEDVLDDNLSLSYLIFELTNAIQSQRFKRARWKVLNGTLSRNNFAKKFERIELRGTLIHRNIIEKAIKERGWPLSMNIYRNRNRDFDIDWQNWIKDSVHTQYYRIMYDALPKKIIQNNCIENLSISNGRTLSNSYITIKRKVYLRFEGTGKMPSYGPEQPSIKVREPTPIRLECVNRKRPRAVKMRTDQRMVHPSTRPFLKNTRFSKRCR